MKKILLILIVVFSFLSSKAQLIQVITSTKNNFSSVDTLFLNPNQIFYVTKGTPNQIWYQDVSLGRSVVYGVGTNATFDSITNQANRYDNTLVKLLKADKISNRDTSYIVAISTKNILYAKNKTYNGYAAKTEVSVKLGSNSNSFKIIETSIQIKSRIDSLFNASYILVTNP